MPRSLKCDELQLDMIVADYFRRGHGEDNSERRKRVSDTLFEILNKELTEKQREYIYDMLAGNKYEAIAQIHGVDKSTVCRTVNRGLHRIKKYSRYMELR